MSHVVCIATRVRDPGAVSAACRRLGLAEPVTGTAQLFRNLWTNNFPISSCGRDGPVVETRQNGVEEDSHGFLEAFDDLPARFVDLGDDVGYDR